MEKITKLFLILKIQKEFILDNIFINIQNQITFQIIKKQVIINKQIKIEIMANEYFTLMNKARKEGAKSFTYKGKTYVATKTKTGMTVYKQK